MALGSRHALIITAMCNISEFTGYCEVFVLLHLEMTPGVSLAKVRDKAR